MSVEKSSTVEMQCRCCGEKESFVLPSIISDTILGFTTRFEVYYACFNCTQMQETLEEFENRD